MALIIKIQINAQPIVIIGAQRIEDDVVPGVNRYKITSYDYRADKYDGEIREHGTLLHTYDNSAEVLAKKAIERVIERV